MFSRAGRRQKIVILRGVSGSGKTTWAVEHYAGRPDWGIVSADDFFFDPDTGEYDFDPRLLQEAHGDCFRRAIEQVQGGLNVCVDNTNSRLWEMSPYVMLGKAYDLEIEVIRFVVPAAVAALRSEHRVPRHVIESMERRFERLPPFWPEERVIKTWGIRAEPS